MSDIEESSYSDSYGNTLSSDPFNTDTDGDGLSDGYEAGDIVIDSNGNTYRKIRSNPLKVDSDNDGLDDAFEDYLGTDALKSDTDNDGIKDAEDDDPLVPIVKPHFYDPVIKNAREYLWTEKGLIFGECGIKDGSMNFLVGDEAASSGAYFVGWMTSGYAIVGDVRDIAETLYQEDHIGAGLNAIGIIPLVGDAGKSINTARKVVTKYPGKAIELGIYQKKFCLMSLTMRLNWISGTYAMTVQVEGWSMVLLYQMIFFLLLIKGEN